MVMPQNLLVKNLEKRVSIVLKDGRIISGKLGGYDEYMNMVIEEAEEEIDDSRRKLGSLILRGNNVVSIQPQ